MVGRRGFCRTFAVSAAVALALGATAAASAGAAARTAPGARHPSSAACALGPHGSVKHVIYLQFDNVHYTRDNPNVPSDLQQLPNLLHFITGHGTMITHEHTPLIAHTADDIVTSESGLYGSHQGVPIANEYQYYKPDGTTDEAGSFAYWADPVGDSNPTMIGSNGKMAPAPWVAYTRGGCNFGTVAAANTELENTLPDVAV